MPPATLATVLVAAVAHAAWNLASTAKRGDTVLFVAVYTAGSTVLCLPLAVLAATTGSQPVTWPLLGAAAVSAALHLAYSLTLQAGYDRADLGVVYPVARGTGPLLTTVLAVAVLGMRGRTTIALAGNGDDGEGELEDLDGRLIDQGVSDNGRRAARSFVASVLSRLDEQDPLYQRFLSDDPEEVAQLLEELVPEVSGAAFQAALSASGLTTAALNNRAAALGANAGDLLTETGAWVRVLDGDAKQGRRSGIAGFDADSRGIVVGADGKLNESTTLGLAFSHVRTDVDSQLGQETEVTSNLLSAYGRWEQGRFGITGSLSYGLADNDGKRYVAGEALKSSYDSRTLAAEIEAGYRYDLGNVELEPLLGSRYSRVSIDGFREKGSAAALDNGSQDLEVFDLGAGLAVSARLGELTPRARLMAYHDFAQDRIQTTSAFILGGESFIATGADATPWTYEADLGLDWSRGQYTLGVSYDYTRKADFKADTWSLKARYDF